MVFFHSFSYLANYNYHWIIVSTGAPLNSSKIISPQLYHSFWSEGLTKSTLLTHFSASSLKLSPVVLFYHFVKTPLPDIISDYGSFSVCPSSVGVGIFSAYSCAAALWASYELSDCIILRKHQTHSFSSLFSLDCMLYFLSCTFSYLLQYIWVNMTKWLVLEPSVSA